MQKMQQEIQKNQPSRIYQHFVLVSVDPMKSFWLHILQDADKGVFHHFEISFS